MFAFSFLGSVLGGCACTACGFVSKEAMQQSARVAFCILFTLAMVEAWVLRDFAQPLLEKLPWILRHEGESRTEAFYGQQAVYRVSIGNFLFFGLLSVVMLGVRYKSDNRDKHIQHGSWLLKTGLWVLCNILPFLLPVGLVNSYGWLARVGSCCFLCMQVLMLLDFVVTWNNAWVDMEDERYLWGLLGVTGGAFAGTAGLTGILFYFFNSTSADCSFNVAIIVSTIVLGLVMSAVSVSGLAPNGSLFPAAIFTLYCTYLAYSALVSEPHSYECNSLGHKLNAASASTLATGMGLALLSVVYSALRAGSNTALFNLAQSVGAADEADRPLLTDKENAEEGTSAGLDGAAPGKKVYTARTAEDEEGSQQVTYSYSFFHLVFALASQYIAMLMTGWGTNPQERDLIDVGWASVWIKLATQWVTAATYVWMLIAPAVFPDRDFA